MPGSVRLVIFEAALQPVQSSCQSRISAAEFVYAQFIGVIEEDREAALDLVGAEPSLDVPDAITGEGVFGGIVNFGCTTDLTTAHTAQT